MEEKTKSRHASTEQRRREILDAALACFTDLGYSEARMSDIRKRSGASTGSIYHHFQSKDRLAAELYLEGIRNYQIGFLQVVESNPLAKEGVRGMIEYHLNWVRENKDWAKFLFQMRYAHFMASVERQFNELNKEFSVTLGLWLRAHATDGAIKTLPVDMFTALLLGPCQEFSRQYLAGSTTTNIKAASAFIADASWNAVRAEE
jgi:AcrR family transcriptional regulator